MPILNADRRKILVTGADGLLGRHTIAELKNNFDIHALVRTLPDEPVENVHYFPMDFSEHWSIGDLPPAVDTVIHLAQSAHFREFPEKALDVFHVNVASAARLLDYACRSGASRFIYASSGGVYGSGRIAFDENAPIMPPDKLGYYLGSKLCGEVLVKNYAHLMSVIVLRFFFMYGPRQKRSMLMPRLMDNIKAGRPVAIAGEQGIRINPVHVADATRAVVSAIGLKQSATFNIAGPEVLSIRQIAEGFGAYLGRKPVFETAGGQPQDLIADISLMRSKLHEPRRRLLESIADVAV